MAGFVSTPAVHQVAGSGGGTERFEAGWARGRADGTEIKFVLTVRVEDLDAMLARPATPAQVTGTVVAPALSGRALTVVRGQFQLLVHDPDHVETWNMTYDLELVSRAGEQFRLRGFKVLHQRPGFSAWRDTTTLFVTVTSDHPKTERLGIMRLTPGDLIRQVRTMRVLHVRSPKRRIEYLGAFLNRFAHSLIHIYGGVLDEASQFPQLPEAGTWEPPTLERLRRPLGPEVHWLDGNKQWQGGSRPDADARLCLTRYRRGSKGPVILAPGFGMAASSFLATTIDENLVEYLVKHDYDVWLFDYRASIHLQRAATSRFTLDNIATEDWPEAVAAVQRLAGVADVQVVAHCVGSVTLLMALLAGMTGVRSAVCSQFTTQPDTSWFNLLKAHLRVGQLLQVAGVRYVRPPVRRGLPSYALDIALRAVPMAGEERCGRAVCRWINAVYGLTHHHAQLNDATHDALIDAFGVGELDAFDHIAVIMRYHRALDSGRNDAYLPYPGRLNIPIHFLIGAYNYIFFPPGSYRTIQWLKANNDPRLYTYTYLPGYAHLDSMIGRDAASDVYPEILAHLGGHPPPPPPPPPGAAGPSPPTIGPVGPTP
jgi:cholesterol oxidase